MIDDFNGDNERLIASIGALLDLDEAKALVPHGIGGHARGLLSAAGVRLAAKDREIAELRARVAEQQEAVDQAVAMAEYLEGHSKGAMAERVKSALSAKFAQERAKYIVSLRNEHYDLQGEHTETLALLGAWQQRAQRAESERDEARECVRRLVGAIRRALVDAPESIPTEEAIQPIKASAMVYGMRLQHFDLAEPLRAALAATPEHLRNA